MAITFNNIPSVLRLEGSYIEIGNTDARASTHTQRALLIGYARHSSYNTAINTLYELTSQYQVDGLFRHRSDFSTMYKNFRLNNPTMPVYGIVAYKGTYYDGTYYIYSDSQGHSQGHYVQQDTVDLTDTITALAGEQFDYIVSDFANAASITQITDELEARWHAGMPGMLFVDPGGFNGSDEDYETLKAFGESLNSPHVTVMGSRSNLAAAYCGAVSKQLAIDPNSNLHGLKINYVNNSFDDEGTLTQKNELLQSGVSVYDINGEILDNRIKAEIRINSAITCYKEDSSYLYVYTVALLKEIRRRQVAHYELQFANHLLAADGMAIAPGIAVVTPSIWKAELIKLYRDFEIRGWVQDVERYAESIICEINADNPNRLDYRDEPILAGQFRTLAGQMQFN